MMSHDLPTMACFKPQCQHSCGNWLAYQSSLTDARLVEFNLNGTIKQYYVISFGSQPLKSMKVVVDYCQQEKETVPYVALAFLSKYTIFKKNVLVASHSLELKCNISDFNGGLVAVEGVNDGMQVYFVFVTAFGRILTAPVKRPEDSRQVDIELKDTICSLSTKNTVVFLGTEAGTVLKVDLNTRKILKTYDTASKLPVMNIKMAGEHLILGTCHGELHILDMDLKQSKVVPAHEAMVSLLLVADSRIYSVGDDFVFREWELLKEGTLLQRKHQFFVQKPNLLFRIGERVFMNFYEETGIFEI